MGTRADGFSEHPTHPLSPTKSMGSEAGEKQHRNANTARTWPGQWITGKPVTSHYIIQHLDSWSQSRGLRAVKRGSEPREPAGRWAKVELKQIRFDIQVRALSGGKALCRTPYQVPVSKGGGPDPLRPIPVTCHEGRYLDTHPGYFRALDSRLVWSRDRNFEECDTRRGEH